MTRDEVMAMTDDELRIKAAELMGIENQFMCHDDSDDIRPCLHGAEDVSDCLVLSSGKMARDCICREAKDVPDYPNDIAAAIDLVGEARKNDFWWSAVFKIDAAHGYDDNPFYEVRFRCVRGATRGDHIANALIEGGDDEKAIAKATCRAFILAMEENHE